MNLNNPTTDLILAHKTERQFTDESIDRETIAHLTACAQAAASSQFIQAYSVIHITDPAIKAQLAALTGHPHTEKNGALLIIVADLNRHAQLLDDPQELQNAESLLAAVIDASLAAQNLTLAAESLGLGACYLGSLRSHDQAVIDLLSLPAYTYPLFGIALGRPKTANPNPAKPRLPQPLVLMENRYQQETPNYSAYDAVIADYYQNRLGKAGISWTDKIRQIFAKPLRRHVQTTLNKQQLNRR